MHNVITLRCFTLAGDISVTLSDQFMSFTVIRHPSRFVIDSRARKTLETSVAVASEKHPDTRQPSPTPSLYFQEPHCGGGYVLHVALFMFFFSSVSPSLPCLPSSCSSLSWRYVGSNNHYCLWVYQHLFA